MAQAGECSNGVKASSPPPSPPPNEGKAQQCASVAPALERETGVSLGWDGPQTSQDSQRHIR